jgi:hypothetical protein
MNRLRWISVGVVVLFVVVTILAPAWKEHAGLASHKSADGRYVAFVLLCMGVICLWWSDTASSGESPTPPEQGAAEDAKPGNDGRNKRRVGWLLLALSIAISAADLIR